MAEMYRATVTRTNPGQAWVHVPYLHPDAEWGPFPAVDGIKAGDSVVAVSTDEAIDGDFIIVNGVGPGSGSAGVGPDLHLTGNLQVDGTTTLPAINSQAKWDGSLHLTNDSPNTEVFGVKLTSDSESRIAMQSSGTFLMGDGAGGQDWFLYRVNTGLAELDGAITIWNDNSFYPLSIGANGNSNQSLFVSNTGQLLWTDGTNAADLTMQRTGVSEMTIGGNIKTSGIINPQLTAHKTAEPTRNTNTALSADPELILHSLPTGNYGFFFPFWYQTTAAAGLKYRLNGTGTTGTDWGARISNLASGGLAFDNSTFTQAGVDTAFHNVLLWGVITIFNGPRDIWFEWCQNASDAGPTKILLMSNFHLYRI